MRKSRGSGPSVLTEVQAARMILGLRLQRDDQELESWRVEEVFDDSHYIHYFSLWGVEEG